MTRILHVISGIDASAGGTATALAALASAQAEAGLAVSVVSTFAPRANLDLVEKLKRDGVAVHLVGPTDKPLARHPDLSRVVTNLVAETDVVHVHALWEEIQHVAMVEAREARKPYVVTPHGMLDPWSLKQRALKKRIYRLWRLNRDLRGAAAIHFADEVERDLALGANRLTAPPLVIRHVVDLSDFQTLPARGTFRAKHPEIGETPYVLFLSRLHPKKNIEALLRAFSAAEFASLKLVLAGPGDAEYVDTLRALVRTLRLDGRVMFTDMLRGAERVEAMVEAELFVLPSLQENFGLVVVEALATGLAVVVSNRVNIHRVVTENDLGIVVEPNEIEIAGAMKRLLKDQTLRAEIAPRARRFAFDRYSPHAISTEWLAAYAEILAR